MNLLNHALSSFYLFLFLTTATISYSQQGFFLTSHSPKNAENHIHPAATIKLNFNQPVSMILLPQQPLIVFGDVLGYYDGTFAFENGNRTFCFKPKQPFCVGENVQITVSRLLMSADTQQLGRPYSFSFNVATGASSPHFRLLRSISLNNSKYPVQLSSCDLNRDGLIDFVVDAYGNPNEPSRLAILRNAGNQIGQYNFEEKISGASSCCFLLANFDNDLYADLIAIDFGNNALQFLKGWGNYFSDSHIFHFLKRPVWGDMADYDGDGDIDFAIASLDTGGAVFDNDGSANFHHAKSFGEDRRLRFISWGDVNHDGRFDLLVSEIIARGGTLVAYPSDSLGNFRFASQIALKDYATYLQMRDLDGDGDLDVVAVEPVSPTQMPPHIGIVEVLTNSGEGKFSSQQMLVPRGFLPFLLDCRDLDGDGDIDIACANSGSDDQPDSTVAFFLNDGKGNFTWAGNLKVGRLPKGLRLVDINQDSRLDLAVLTVDPPALHLFLADTLTSRIGDKPIPTTPRLSLKINPNPFREVVIIHLQAPLNTAGEMRIFDLVGRQIFAASVLMRHEKETIVWNGRDSSNQIVPSGIYLAKLQVGSESASQKLLLLR